VKCMWLNFILFILSVSKRIAPSDLDQDLDLSSDLFVIFARRLSESPSLNGLTTHADGGPSVRGTSEAQVNPVNGVGIIGGSDFDAIHRPNLIRAHGILMIIAWPMLAVTGIFFALFMRPALPNGEWFQVML